MANNLLKGKKGIIFGALDEKSIAWKTALKCHAQGAQIVLSNAPVALRMGEINKLAEAVKAPVIGADVTNMDDLKNLFEKSMEHFGGKIDFVLHSIGMSPNVRKNISYTDTNYDNFHKTLDISALSEGRSRQTAPSRWGETQLPEARPRSPRRCGCGRQADHRPYRPALR